MTGIRNVKKSTCVIALVIFYENRTHNPTKVFMVLNCVLNYVIDNYFRIDYIYCPYKTISETSSDKGFKVRVTMNCLVLALYKC